MNCEIVKAIDEVLAFLVANRYTISQENIRQFRELSSRVYEYAFLLGIDRAIPQVADLSQQLNFPEVKGTHGEPQKVWFEGKLNLPVDWLNGGECCIYPEGMWLDSMLSLRSLAELSEQCNTDNPEESISNRPVTHVATGVENPKTKKLSLDARALAIFIENPRLTKTEVATRLGLQPQSLAPRRVPKLENAMAAYRGTDKPPRGSKSKEGDVEACSDKA